MQNTKSDTTHTAQFIAFLRACVHNEKRHRVKRETYGYRYESETHRVIASTVIKHFDCPRREARKMSRFASLHAKQRPPLTLDERAEIGQTVALVLIARDCFDTWPRRNEDKLRLWRESFIACRAVIQRLRSTCAAREELSALDSMDAHDGQSLALLALPALPDVETLATFEARLKRKTRVALLLIRAAFHADNSRKRVARAQGARDTLRYCLSGVLPYARLHKTPLFPNDAARRKAIERLQLYLTEGLVAKGNETPTLREGNFQSFAQVCTAMDAGKLPRISHTTPRMKLAA